MTLYHFTRAALFPKIFTDGLIGLDHEGGWLMPHPSDPTLSTRTPFGWLTSDPEFDNQHWADSVTSDQCKREIRIEVQVFDYEVLPWLDMRDQLNAHQLAIIEKDSPDVSKWYLLTRPLDRSRLNDTAATNPLRTVERN